MTIKANGIIFLNEGRSVKVENKLFTGEADNGPAPNSIFNAFLDGANCSVEFTNLRNGVFWERRNRNGIAGVLEIDGRRTRRQSGHIEGTNHKVHAFVKGKGDVEVTWEAGNSVERL